MKIHKIATKELDRRLELDRRKDAQGFRIIYESLDAAPKGFYDLQNKIRDGLQKQFWLHFDDGDKQLRREPWESKRFFFNTDMFGSERIVIEVGKEILGDSLIDLIVSYLDKNRTGYCVTASVYESMSKGSNYLGRFVVTLTDIAVEESLAGIWSRRVKRRKLKKT